MPTASCSRANGWPAPAAQFARACDRIALLSTSRASYGDAAVLKTTRRTCAGCRFRRPHRYILRTRVAAGLSLSHVPQSRGPENFASDLIYLDREPTRSPAGTVRLPRSSAAPGRDLAYLIYTSVTTGKPGWPRHTSTQLRRWPPRSTAWHAGPGRQADDRVRLLVETLGAVVSGAPGPQAGRSSCSGWTCTPSWPSAGSPR